MQVKMKVNTTTAIIIESRITKKVCCILFSILLVIVILPSAFTLSDSRLTLDYSFDMNPCHQGENITITFTIMNTGTNQERITWAGVSFDWMAPNIYYADNGTHPLATGQTTTFVVHGMVPDNICKGLHSYYVLVKYDDQQGQNGWTSYQLMKTQGDLLVLQKQSNDRGNNGGGGSTNGTITPTKLALIAIGIIIVIFMIFARTYRFKTIE
jgi:hypothetical protein